MSRLVYVNKGTMTVQSSEEKDLKDFFRLIITGTQTSTSMQHVFIGRSKKKIA